MAVVPVRPRRIGAALFVSSHTGTSADPGKRASLAGKTGQSIVTQFNIDASDTRTFTGYQFDGVRLCLGLSCRHSRLREPRRGGFQQVGRLASAPVRGGQPARPSGTTSASACACVAHTVLFHLTRPLLKPARRNLCQFRDAKGRLRHVYGPLDDHRLRPGEGEDGQREAPGTRRVRAEGADGRMQCVSARAISSRDPDSSGRGAAAVADRRPGCQLPPDFLAQTAPSPSSCFPPCFPAVPTRAVPIARAALHGSRRREVPGALRCWTRRRRRITL